MEGSSNRITINAPNDMSLSSNDRMLFQEMHRLSKESKKRPKNSINISENKGEYNQQFESQDCYYIPTYATNRTSDNFTKLPIMKITNENARYNHLNKKQKVSSGKIKLSAQVEKKGDWPVVSTYNIFTQTNKSVKNFFSLEEINRMNINQTTKSFALLPESLIKKLQISYEKEKINTRFNKLRKLTSPNNYNKTIQSTAIQKLELKATKHSNKINFQKTTKCFNHLKTNAVSVNKKLGNVQNYYDTQRKYLLNFNKLLYENKRLNKFNII